MIWDKPHLDQRELESLWLELTLLKRDAELLCGALADAGFDVEAASASVIVSGLSGRLENISDQLQRLGSDQPRV